MRRPKNGFAQPSEHQVVGKGERQYVDDIIFPKMDMCLISLVGWFNPSPTNNNFDLNLNPSAPLLTSVVISLHL